MRKLALLALLPPLLLSCTQNSSQTEKQACAIPPILDSLINAAKPLTNTLIIDDLKENIIKRYSDFEGVRFVELDSLDFKIDALKDCGNDTVFIALISRGYVNEYSYIFRVTSYIDKKEALSLDEALKYHVGGILKSAPEKLPFIDGVYAPEIDLGIFPLDSLKLIPITK